MTYRELLGDLDQWFARGVANAGHNVVLCRRGCSACCLGPFDLSAADAEIVADAVDRLEPAMRDLVRIRARNQVTQYAEIEPAWRAPWAIHTIGDQRFDELGNQMADHPCPALGDDGACTIYDDRPANCRMIGLAMRTPEGGILDNACPILLTSKPYAELDPTLYDLERFELAAEGYDIAAAERGWVSTTVAGAIAGHGET